LLQGLGLDVVMVLVLVLVCKRMMISHKRSFPLFTLMRAMTAEITAKIMIFINIKMILSRLRMLTLRGVALTLTLSAPTAELRLFHRLALRGVAAPRTPTTCTEV
jgi:hypothetical protein